MRAKQIKKFLLVFFVLFFFVAIFNPAGRSYAAVQKKILKPDPAKILTYYVVDEENKSLQSKNITKVVPVASLTKMMSAVVFLENRVKEWDEQIIYNPQRHFVYGNYLKLKKGDAVTVKDLLYSMLVASVNEAPQMLIDATNLSEKEFISKMNEKAKVFKMDKTQYVDVSGISSKNISSASDQIKLLEEVYKYTELREVMDVASYAFDVTNTKGGKVHHQFKHTNSLLNKKTDFTILASKTGYLWEAKNNLAMIVQKNGRIYYSVTMGDPSRWGDYSNTEALLKKILPQQISGRF